MIDYLPHFTAHRAAQTEHQTEMTRLKYQVYLSDPKSAVPGGVYFCGLKPYGRPGVKYEFPTLPPPGFTTYRDQPSPSPFHPRARQIIHHALRLTLSDKSPLEAALCTNWFFHRAADTKQLKAFDLTLESQIEHHQKILDEYQPNIVICAGNGPFSSYAGMLLLHGVETLVEENYLGRSKLRATRSGKRTVIGVPHLSRYEVTEGLLEFVTRVHKKG